MDVDLGKTPRGLWKSSEMVAENASSFCGSPSLPAAGAEDTRMTANLENCSKLSDCRARSLPDMFFDYSDLEALKHSSPCLHIWDAAEDSVFRGAIDAGSEVAVRVDEMKAVLSCFELVASAITRRIRVSEELFNDEMRGHRPVSCFSDVFVLNTGNTIRIWLRVIVNLENT